MTCHVVPESGPTFPPRRAAAPPRVAPPPPAAQRWTLERAPAESSRLAFHPSETGAATADAHSPVAPSLATLLTRHILRDGELVILILKPSIWFIPLSAIKFIAAVLILLIAAHLFDHKLPSRTLVYIELAVFVLAGRLMWAVLQWMGRLYVLTDLRVVRISGVFTADIFDCPLRKIDRTRLQRSMREHLVGRGSIEFIPMDDTCPIGVWQTISRPREIHAQVEATIRRARHHGGAGDGR